MAQDVHFDCSQAVVELWSVAQRACLLLRCGGPGLLRQGGAKLRLPCGRPVAPSAAPVVLRGEERGL